MSNKSNFNRRKFLKHFASSSVAGAGALSALGMSSASANIRNDDHKALVCIFLLGGNDGFNMVVPTSDAEYQQYSQIREGLAIPREGEGSLLGINPAGDYSGPNLGLHPSMSGARDLFQDGNLGIISNVGTLIKPTTRDLYINRAAENHPLPSHLFSHNDQQTFWQSLRNKGVEQPLGWAGRMADILMNDNANQTLSMNISLSGSNVLLRGKDTTPYIMSPKGVVSAQGLDGSSVWDTQRSTAFNHILNNNHQHIFAKEYAKIKRRSLGLVTEITDAFSAAQPITTPFPAGNNLAQSLKSVAKMISARDQLGFSRQTFFIGVGGWDTHSNQLAKHSDLLAQLSSGLKYFYDTTVELGIENQVATFTASDFGRTLTSNGDGTDHGWGSHQMVMGGAVGGGRVYGEFPSMVIGGADDSGSRGRIIPTTSVDQYAAALARWFGINEADINSIFPNLANFENTENKRDLSFI